MGILKMKTMDLKQIIQELYTVVSNIEYKLDPSEKNKLTEIKDALEDVQTVLYLMGTKLEEIHAYTTTLKEKTEDIIYDD
tara:strand:+ start:114 stop:353 length:240 start_codon:yes stop_codon:yes gene_type:complete